MVNSKGNKVVLIALSIFLSVSVKTSSQSEYELVNEIDRLSIEKAKLKGIQDSIGLRIKQIEERQLGLEVDRLKLVPVKEGIPAIIVGDYCRESGSTFFANRQEVSVIGFLGGTWLIVANGKERFVGDLCIEFIDKTINRAVLKLKFTNESKKEDFSVTNSQVSTANKEHSELDAIGKTNFPLRINKVEVTDINSAGGVSFMIRAGYFKKDKIIKYLRFTVAPYNAVGDIVKCDIRGASEFVGLVTGPIESRYLDESYVWENAWYNTTVECIKLLKVQVEYMDGSSYTYVSELNKILGDFKNNCSYSKN